MTPWRRYLGLGLGVYAGVLLSAYQLEVLRGAPGWPDVVRQEPETALWVLRGVALPFPFVSGLIGWGFVTFLEVQGWMSAHRRTQSPLPAYPFDPDTTQLVLGELHNQDGTRSDTPGWLVLPEKGMTTGLLVTGATGSAKTSGAQYPYTAQCIRLHADDPDRKLGGLIIDAKGNYAEFVRRQCADAGRLDDYYEVSLESGVRYNIIGRPDLSAPALGGHIADMIANVQGDSYSDPFWHQEAKDLATQCIRVIRLCERREPTMADLYRLATSFDTFESWIRRLEGETQAGTREVSEAEKAELESLDFWLQQKAGMLDPKLRSAIAAGLNGVCSLFDSPRIREVFCPAPTLENFLGFDELIARGQIVALRVPYSELKTVSQVVGTMTKLNFFDGVLNRLARADAGHADVGRTLFFVADEYDGYVTQPADGNFLSKCREARCCTIIATQSYESLVAKLRNEHVAGQLLSNLRTKVWLCAEDNYTAEQAARLCGEVERLKVGRSRSANSKRSAYSFLDGKIISADAGSVGESTNYSYRREHLFPARAFTSLRLNQAIVKMFDGERVADPTYLYLKPIYGDPNLSWFEDRV
jgi:hypothetical protein